jgi:prepilin-type N-terminal cleavage/methylation domain-containing protein
MATASSQALHLRLPPPGGEGWAGGRSWYTLHHPSLTLPLKGRGPEVAERRGLTLIELLLAMALLVTIAGLAAPIVTNSFSSVRLRRAGDQVLTAWSKARARAVENGAVIQFRYQPETGAYRIEPWIDVSKEESDPTNLQTASATEPSAETSDADDAEQTLPEAITFHSGRISAYDPVEGTRRVDSLKSSGDDLSTPLLFFPNGTTSSASIGLVNDRGQYLQLTLRGLTGVGRASPILSQEEYADAAR